MSLIPTGEGDPVLVRAEAPILSGERVVLSKDAADLRVDAGGSVEAVITRMRGSEERQTVRLPLEVAAVLPLSASKSAQAFAPFLVLVAVENYREWRAVPRYGWSGAAPIADPFASFRLYAKNLDDVEPLRRWLRSQHLDVESAADRIAAVKRIDRDLSILLSVLLIPCGHRVRVGPGAKPVGRRCANSVSLRSCGSSVSRRATWSASRWRRALSSPASAACSP